MTSFISPVQTDAFGLSTEILGMLPCLAFGSYIEEVEFDARCMSMCQRPENPCIVDIDFVLEGDGEYEIVPEYTLFSLDTTNGFDGKWHVLQPVETDPLHFGQFITAHGQVAARYVADLCDHVSTFFSEPRVCFRLTFREKEEVQATFGGFDDAVDEAQGTNPKVTPTGGCRTSFFGFRYARR